MGKEVVLRNTSEKFAYLRETLNITTKDLAGNKVTEKFIRMVERQKRNMSKDTAIEVMRNVIDFANEKGIDLDLDEEYLARSKEDDLCEICDKLENTIENRDIFNKIIEYAEENNYPWAKIIATKKIGNMVFINGEFNKAYEVYLSCLNMIDKLKSNRYKDHIYTNIGNVKLNIAKYEEALVYYEEALNYCYINNCFKIKNNIEYNLASTLYNLNNFDRSMKISEEVLSQNIDGSLYLKFQILRCANYMKNNYIEDALLLYKEICKNDLNDNLSAAVYNNIALCYMHKNKYEESKKYFDLSLRFAKCIPEMTYKIILDMATMNKKVGDYLEAKKLFKKGIELSKNTENYIYRIGCLKELYFLEEMQKNNKQMRDLVLQILDIAKNVKLDEEIIWARKKLIDIAMKENDLSILKEA